MTAQEKWTTTIRYMELVRKNYLQIKKGMAYRIADTENRRQVQELRKWVRAVERAYRTLRLRQNKSSARARRDWLVARAIELMLFEGVKMEKVKCNLNSPYPLNRKYMDELMRDAVLAVQKAAWEEGLLGD